MGKKYIIELEDNESVYKTVYNTIIADEHPILQVIAPAPYTEPDLEQVRKEAYQQGLNDAWECARKIVTTKGIPADDMAIVFDDEVNYDYIFSHYSAHEAIEKIRQYEQEKEMDGLRQNIQTIVDQCGYTLDEIAEVLRKMKEGS